MLLKANEATRIYEVSQLVCEAGLLLGQHFSQVWVSGEISNLSLPKSGHVYFSLKDHKSQIRCALFSRYQSVNFQLKEGAHVLIKAAVSIYEARGDFQLIVHHIELEGEGKLRQAFDLLKAKLFQEGLFDEKHKKALPQFPHTVGVITSSTGAAVKDVLAMLKKRFASIPIIIYPVLVQGKLAAEQIVYAIERANQRLECDVLLLCRGGGSIEDLWPFNEEIVARAIYQSHLPVVTGIGHEIDVTIADFVADARAPTPSGAATLIAQDATTLLNGLNQQWARLIQVMQANLTHEKQHLLHLEKRLQHPQARLNLQFQTLNDLKQRLLKAIEYQTTGKANQLKQTRMQLESLSPLNKIFLLRQQCASMQENLIRKIRHEFAMREQRINGLKQAIDSVNPLNTLKRGYAIALKDRQILMNAAQVKPGDKIQIKLAEGELVCLVL